ncbi:MAG TPA: TolC family protein [Steroidobacteraceae bacterium]
MRVVICSLLILFSAGVIAQGTVAGGELRPVAEIIDEYVAEGLKSNLALRNGSLEVERNLAALDEARARYFPELALAARDSRSHGGREIDLPLGTTLNPVYSTLNQLLAQQGRAAEFTQIADQSIPFLLPREQDTRITVRQPLFAPAIPAAVRAQRALLEASDFARLALARQLKRDVTTGYLRWLQGMKTVAIVEASQSLLQENLRVSDSLFRNGKVTQDQVLRARAELLAVEQQLREARNACIQAQSYLNFLLNRDLATPLEQAAVDAEIARTGVDLAQLRAAALAGRPELNEVEREVRASQEQVRASRAALWPTLSLGVDAGTTGETYGFGSGFNYNTISLLLNWRFYSGGGDQARVREARALARQAAIRRDELALQIQLEVQQAVDRLTSSIDSLATAQARAVAARAGFRIASRKRDEGVINQVEFIDARTALTGAELNLNLTRFDVLSSQAEVDHATANGRLPPAVAAL